MSGLGRIAATAVLDINPFEQSTRVLETRIRSVDRAMAAQETSIKNSGRSINGLKANYNLTGKSLETHTEILRQQKQKYEELTASIKDVNQATIAQKTDILAAEAAMNKTAGKVEELTGKYNSLGREIAIQDSNWTKVGNGLESVGSKMTTVGEGMTSFGNKWSVGVTAPIVAGVAASVKASIDFESAFAGTKKTVDELVDANGNVIISYDDLAKGIRDMAKELPASATEISEVAEAAGQLGIKTDNVLSFSRTMIDLGESTNMSAEEAATALARLANITRMPQTEFDKLGSVIVDLGNNFATTESEITAMGLRLAGAGSQVKMSEAEIMGFAAALSSVGIEAEAGGSAFSKVMVNMQLAVETGQGAFEGLIDTAARNGIAWNDVASAYAKGGKELKNMSNAMGLGDKGLKDIYKSAEDAEGKLNDFAHVAGVSADDFATAFKKDASGAIIQFIKGLGEMEGRGSSAIKTLDDMGITEVRMRDALLRASGASDVFTNAVSMGTKAWGENTALTEEASKRYETTESKLKMLKNQINDVAIEFGGPFVDALRDGLTAVMPLIENLGKLAKSFSNAEPETKKMIVNTLALTAAIGPASSILGKLLKIGGGGISTLGSLAKHLGIVSGNAKASKAAFELTSEGLLKMVGGSTAAEAGLAGVATKTAGMTSALGLLNPWVLGTAAVVGTGVAVWKLWGEEVYNSAQRTERWGTDVGEATDKTLNSVKNYTTQASGQFDLMSQGLGNNSSDMADNFVKIGETIEQSLIKKIEGLDKLIKELPASVDGSVKEMVEKEKKETETALEIVQKNNERIYEMKKNASDKGIELTVVESKIIQDLAEQSTRAYVETLDLTSKEKKKIMDAMNGDVENASDKEAKLWLQSLGKQRQAAAVHMTASRKEKEKYLEDLGYNLDGEFAQKFIKAWDEINQTTVDGFDQQMSTIVEKYPELMDEVFLANGQVISGNDQMAQSMIDSNKEIISSVKDMTYQINESATKNAKELELVGKEGTKAGDLWNNIVLDDKKANVKTNAQEELNKATKSSDTWKKLAFHSKEAKLSSNAKLMLAEAAIANGHWETMSWKDKKAVIDSNATQTIIEAMQKEGIWDGLSFEQKKAVLYSDTPEKVGRAVSDLGLWNQMGWRVHKLKADNHDYLNKINMTEEYLNRWNALPVEVKDIMLENTDYSFKILESEDNYRRFSSLPDNEKKLIAKNEQLVNTIVSSENMYIRWSQLPSDTKQMLGNNVDLLNKVFGSEAAYTRWMNLPEGDKKILGNNSDLMTKVFSSVETYNAWIKLPEKEKILIGNNGDILNKISAATSAIDTYNSIDTPLKNLTSDTNAGQSKGLLDDLLWSWNQIPLNETKTQTIQQDFIGPRLPGYEKGTNNHPGGGMVINDQQSRIYEELVQFPGKEPFVAKGRNVLIPNAPRGTKVWTARQTKDMLPHYAGGVGLNLADTKISQVMSRVKLPNEGMIINNNFDKGLSIKLDKLILLLTNNFGNNANTTRNGKAFEGAVFNLYGAQDARELSHELAWIADIEGRGRM
ncbi:phage tail tape measure protein [Enterococcus rotai]|uniref:phage tail tape measure protein n=1 Tax=Enterococcus rotai TaxID=118060 RepID=UPI0035C73558